MYLVTSYSYNIWNYADGHDSYSSSLLVDLTQPPGKVSKTCCLFHFYLSSVTVTSQQNHTDLVRYSVKQDAQLLL